MGRTTLPPMARRGPARLARSLVRAVIGRVTQRLQRATMGEVPVRRSGPSMPDVSPRTTIRPTVTIPPRAVQLTKPVVRSWEDHVLAHADQWIARCLDAVALDPVHPASDHRLGPRETKRLRTALRRLRGIVDVVVGPVDPRKAAQLDRQLARLARRLGAIRDLDVALALLSERREASGSDLERAALDELCGELVRARIEAAARARKRLRGDATAEVTAQVRAALVDRLALPCGDTPGQWWSTHAHSWPALPESVLPDDLDGLHALRSAARRIRHAIELFDEHAPIDARAWLDHARALHRSIGEHRDHALLVARLDQRIARARGRQRIALLRGLEASAIAATAPRAVCLQRVREAIMAARASRPAGLSPSNAATDRGAP